MQAHVYLSMQKEDSLRESLQKDVVKNRPDDAPMGMEYQDLHIQYRSNENPQNNANVIQCFPEESRSLASEAREKKEEMKRRVAALELELADFHISSQFDDDYYDLFVEAQELPVVHETLHHILSRSSIGEFIRNLRKEEKRDILLTFIRYTGGRDGDVTQREYEKIRQGTDEESSALIERMLGKTLKSLRSNLTFGPTVRGDDPKDGFDPNYIYGSGKFDEISACYKEAYDKINELKDPLGSQKHDTLVAEIVGKLIEAESLLAKRQGITGADAYRHTRLEPGNRGNWMLNFKNWRIEDGVIIYDRLTGTKIR